MLCAFIAIAGNFTAAATEVYFSATINQSPFTAPGYTVGSIVTGTFDYTPGTAPYEVGGNYTEYTMSGMHMFFGAAQYDAGITRVQAAHDIGIGQVPPYLDVYTVSGYALGGPSVQGYNPAFAEVQLIDTDHSIYAAISTPYPIDLPNPALFETKNFRVSFFGAELKGTVNSIAVVPEPKSFHILMTCALSAAAVVHRKRAVRNVRPSETTDPDTSQ